MPTQTGTNVTYKYTIIWFNVTSQSTFQLTDGYDRTVKYETKVTPKGLSDVQWQNAPTTTSCSYRGNLTYSVTSVTNATRYVWSNDAGWTGGGTSDSRTATFNINNSNAGNITVIAYNDNCNAISKTNVVRLNRTAVTDVPTFTSTSATSVCATSVGTASIATGNQTPLGYEWYATPAGYMNINGGAYSSEGAALYTTSSSVSLTAINSSVAGPVRLYARAVYGQACKSPVTSSIINIGSPISNKSIISGEKFNYNSGGPTDYYIVCPQEYLVIMPENNFSANILEHQWEVVSGTYGGLYGNLTSPTLSIRTTSVLRASLILRYRFRVSCGWSNWNITSITTMDCNSGEDPYRMNTHVDTASIRSNQSKIIIPTKESTLAILPNPASNNLNIQLPQGTTYKEHFKLLITDMKGNIVINQIQAATSKFTVNISSLVPGNYILQIDTGKDKLSKQFVVVQ